MKCCWFGRAFEQDTTAASAWKPALTHTEEVLDGKTLVTK